MIIAEMAGIRIFVTGGIGGVHRGNIKREFFPTFFFILKVRKPHLI